jgi:GTPase SAR1 family protein
LQRQANTDIVIALVGNKLDLVENEDGEPINNEEHERQVSKEDAQAYADEAGLLFFETSAKSAQNVDGVFNSIAEKIPLDTTYSPNSRNAVSARGNLNNGVNLMQPTTQGNSSSCAC